MELDKGVQYSGNMVSDYLHFEETGRLVDFSHKIDKR